MSKKALRSALTVGSVSRDRPVCPHQRHARALASALPLLLLLFLFSQAVSAADSLPTQLSDKAFWNIVETSSEPDGVFPGDNFVSNELEYAGVILEMQGRVRHGGAYLGVGPEQNFHYIVAVQPRIAFIVDIRRQNLLEHLLYKALFELSTDRAQFLSRLFSRQPPAGVSKKASVKELLNVYAVGSPDPAVFRTHLGEVQSLLVRKHGFPLSAKDEADIERIYKTFVDWGPGMNYSSGPSAGETSGQGLASVFPTYAALMTAVDAHGRNWSYLASPDTYRFVRDMQRRNLIIPLVGDFGGPKTIRAIGKYLRDKRATVSTLYASSVESYLFPRSGAGIPETSNGGWQGYADNVSTLPIDSGSIIVRYQSVNEQGRVDSLQSTVQAAKERRIKQVSDLFPTAR